MLPELSAIQAKMQRQGLRRLLVLSGDHDWCYQQANELQQRFAGDWLWISDRKEKAVPPAKAVSLLGQEYLHGIFDATEGFNAEALAILAGTLKAGSWLVMMVPSWYQWCYQPDKDSMRWNEQSDAIPTPHFIQHIQRQLIHDPQVLLWRQNTFLHLPEFPQYSEWQLPDGNPTASQHAILAQLLRANQGVWVITAPRGRGKSTLAGMLMQQWQGNNCWLTAPAKATTEIIRGYSAEKGQFWAVDNLLKYCRQNCVSEIDWLLIDEAAAIPTPQLFELISYFPRVLLTTTVQGYEGTGRGFLLKFCAEIPNCHILNLTAPVRWAENDPLENWLENALLFEDAVPVNNSDQAIRYHIYHQQQWIKQPELLRQFYGILTSAHYKTSPLDLRRLLDAKGMQFIAALGDKTLAGALWMVDEGGLSPELAHEVWAGRRRPRGNLVAQSLAAHSGLPQAAVLKSQRISRLAVQANNRRQGIAQGMIAFQRARAKGQGIDFISVSFGYTAELWALWQKCGFQLVRMGTHLEASSGCYTAMAIFPLSQQGMALCIQAQQQFARDAYWLESQIGFSLPVDYQIDRHLNQSDWQELSGFAFAHRPFSASLPALQRLLLNSDLPLPALRNHLQQEMSIEQCVTVLKLSGYKALTLLWRQETAQALASFDKKLARYWQEWTTAFSEASRPYHPICH
ncbi:GNAT family N-acetyltransferase [Photorhabdus temperata]|uniref:tRNA(Met) cytidine acetyltransferase TmcA n=2 Tax=Photorhabdus temperata TaxID=574560 RepID=A0A081RZ90_PHOTE|nr:GNAT family N-acetyltransferase [Photorhabdus temperata]EQC00375.1 methionine tRNA cytidine acetyltransferase [Photorhabdus temperata subsp. temperata M1021]ERT12300.1 methionine tRNA cytidine acetyltransferase [Photorhabdus temperata J3]KER03993.1 tRNA(Met)-cytidine N(4)-acetyltransferase [Photorhabdus temperata subsp. temperata Meg1]MCT8347715.1 GNAT family N-acetyltransferase [Photorhabdus temperata]